MNQSNYPHSVLRVRVAAASGVAALVIGLGALGGLVGPARAASVSVPAGVGFQAGDCPSGVRSSAPIVINSDSDWSPYASAGGSGAPGSVGNPFVIKCLAISGSNSNSGAGLSVASAASDVSYTIRDVTLVGGPSDADGIDVPGSTNGTALIENNSVAGYQDGIFASGASASIQIADNFATGATLFGIAASSGQLTMSSNFVSANAGCEADNAARSGQINGDVCADNTGIGYQLNGPNSGLGQLTLTNSQSLDNAGIGVKFLNNNIVAASNLVKGNSTGLYVAGTDAVTGNTIEDNSGAGIDLGGADYSTVTGNTIIDNGGAAITGDPAYTGGPALTFDTDLSGNHIGANAAGIVFLGLNIGDQIWATDWLTSSTSCPKCDGGQSIVDPAGLNTVVDAGSAKNGLAGQPVAFSDYIDRVTIGHDQGGTNAVVQPINAAAGGLDGNTENLSVQPSAGVAVTWAFGDGTSTCVIDATQGHGPPPAVSHPYAHGSYTATLTVSVINPNSTTAPCGSSLPGGGGQSESFSDTVPVTVN